MEKRLIPYIAKNCSPSPQRGPFRLFALLLLAAVLLGACDSYNLSFEEFFNGPPTVSGSPADDGGSGNGGSNDDGRTGDNGNNDEGENGDGGEARSSAKAVTAFTITSPVSATGFIDEEAKTIAVTAPYGTGLNGLTPAITHTGASISPAPGTAQDFTGPVNYTVTAEDGSTAAYTVTVTAASSSAKAITAFSIGGAAGTIDEGEKTISVTVPYGTGLNGLSPEITHTGASISPAPGTAQDFTGTVEYIVTAADGSSETYRVTVTVDSPPSLYLTLYVDENGNDDNSGTSADAPFKTMDAALAAIRTAYDSTWPGYRSGNPDAPPVAARILVRGTITTKVSSTNALFDIVESGALYDNLPPVILAGKTTDESLNKLKVNNSYRRVLYIDKAAVTLEAGLTLTGGEMPSGGGVLVKDGTFTMNGGTISGNKATDYYTSYSGYGGTNGHGGGVAVYSGIFTMNGGTISDNEAAYYGGLSGDYGYGGGVAVDSGSFTMNGGTISDNEAASRGGGVYVNKNSFTMSGNTVITSNSSNYGGGVYVTGAGSTFTMDGGTISDNAASGYVATGGGVYFESTGTFTMSDGTISGNGVTSNGTPTTNAGGGVLVSSGAFTMSGGTISGNGVSSSSTTYGGGVGVFSGTFTMSGGTISGNQASSSVGSTTYTYGGGVGVSSGAFTMSGGTISGNTSKSNNASYGGGVFVNSGSFTKSGGIIYGDDNTYHTPGNDENTDASGNGHAAYVYVGSKKRNSTAGPGVTLDSATSGAAGGWE